MTVFVDTSALFALLDDADLHHRSASIAFATLLETGELVTHNYIHTEAEQLVRRRLGAAAALDLSDVILPSIRTIWVDEATHRAAVEAWRVAGGGASLVDQTSFVVMRSAGITSALAFDRDFDVRGFAFPRLDADSPPRRLSEAKAQYVSSSDLGSLVSVTEIAARSGRPVNTVQSWRRRHPDFPPARADLAAGPIWIWSDVEAWIDRRTVHRAAAPRR